MKVEVEIRVPRELHGLIEWDIETDGKVKLLEVIDRYNQVFDVEAKTVVINVRIGELVLCSYKTEPKERIVVEIPERKLKLLYELLK